MPWPITYKVVYCVFFQFWLLTGFTVTSLPNVARSGNASQSSVSHGGYASKAIDGNKNPNYHYGSCTHTNYIPGQSQWWRLILPAVYRITSINITNRLLVSERINNAMIFIGNNPENNGNNNPRCALIKSIPSGATRNFNCGGMLGRFVNVYLNNAFVLSLCEVEVYGELAIPGQVMGRNVLVVDRKLCWSDALLYCRDFYWDLLSVRSEEEQREMEEMLREASFPLTKHVWLGLRRYLMEGTWFWMSGASVNYSYWDTDRPLWQNTSPCGGVTNGDRFNWRDLTCEDHLHFICLTDFPAEDKRVTFYSSTRQIP